HLLALQHRERRAQRRARDPQPLGQLALGQDRVRRDPALEDVVADAAGGALREGLGTHGEPFPDRAAKTASTARARSAGSIPSSGHWLPFQSRLKATTLSQPALAKAAASWPPTARIRRGASPRRAAPPATQPIIAGERRAGWLRLWAPRSKRMPGR